MARAIAPPSVLVLGSINSDLLVRLDRLPKPGETVFGRTSERALGGKGANQAVAAAKAGALTRLLATAGCDADDMVAELQRHGVGAEGIARVKTPSGTAIVATAPDNNQIVVIPGANAHIDREGVSAARIGRGDVCLTQMETPAWAAEIFFRKARQAGATTVLNLSPAIEDARRLLELTDLLVVNQSELEWLAGQPVDCQNPVALLAARDRHFKSRSLVVTLGAEGAAIVNGRQVDYLAGHRVSAVDTTGAGDCFCGYLCAALARGEALNVAAVEASAAAALSVQQTGAARSIPDRHAVLRSLGRST